MGKQKNQPYNLELTTIPPQNFNTSFKIFEPFENLNLIVVEDICAFNPKK
jgi:hypothetical protein